MAEGNSAYINTGAGAGRRITLEFADGEHSIPDWAVEHIGLEELQGDAAALKAISFEDFMSATVGELSAASLRQFQTRFVSQHMGQFLR